MCNVLNNMQFIYCYVLLFYYHHCTKDIHHRLRQLGGSFSPLPLCDLSFDGTTVCHLSIWNQLMSLPKCREPTPVTDIQLYVADNIYETFRSLSELFAAPHHQHWDRTAHNCPRISLLSGLQRVILQTTYIKHQIDRFVLRVILQIWHNHPKTPDL